MSENWQEMNRSSYRLGICLHNSVLHSFVAETIASSFSGSFWTQLVVKKLVKLISDFGSVNLDFQGMNQEKRPDDMVRNQPATEQSVRALF